MAIMNPNSNIAQGGNKETTSAAKTDDPFELLEALANRHGSVTIKRSDAGFNAGFDVYAGDVAVHHRFIRRAVERRMQIDANDVTAGLGVVGSGEAAMQRRARP